ncbi:DUF3226 domain-containing protein [Beggiatoa leptomitoformis]|uniref:DUF4276 family protein n=1 Tax=Beggiatoa leptomitoformis TaxID=288004 RepID=A0A2N9YF49_9GAMM|nr:DUF3226 domain-containing protein [Beggiatoa leptomitoformis]ALG68552.1 hypothetical protein AL038_13665 [Beggiatoa leptomitoformis]AUI69102.1 hypothetical protein BLE401_10595 [Beggiatoa leptomitoformis]
MYQENLLLVEGDTDKGFFSRLCETLNLSLKVTVAPPRDLGGRYNTKQGVLKHLPTLLHQLNDGSIHHLAIVVDADYVEHHGLGATKTLEQIKEIMSPFGFELRDNTSYLNGLSFKHSDGLSDFGVWIMPDNKKDGMFEDWIKSCIVKDEQALFCHVEKTVADLEQHHFKKFKDIHTTKIEVATWLAWQDLPKYHVDCVLDQKSPLIDKDADSYKYLVNWLKKIYTNK